MLLVSSVVTMKIQNHKVQGASWETDVFEMDVMEQAEGVEAWVGGN